MGRAAPVAAAPADPAAVGADAGPVIVVVVGLVVARAAVSCVLGDDLVCFDGV